MPNPLSRTIWMVLMALMTGWSGASLAQTSPINELDGRRVPKSLLTVISIDLENVPFEEALAVIADKGDIRLSYNRNRIPVHKDVSVKMENARVLDALIYVLKKTDTTLVVTTAGQLAVVPAGKPQQKPETNPQPEDQIVGRVLDRDTGAPLFGANILVVGTRIGASSRPDGRFTIENVPAGIHTLQFSHIGYELERVEHIAIDGKGATDITVELTPKIILLKEIIVVPGQFSIMGTEPSVQQTLTRQDLETIPLGEDIYRAINRLPGISSSDFSAKFTVRGSENEEVLVLMDGLELYEPFHLKDIDGGALSIIDIGAIEGIDLMTGGFSAEYGDRMSGVFNMRSTGARGGKNRTSLGISFMNARFMSEGSFQQNRGSWLLSARRGYLDLILRLMDEKDPPQPVYYDVFGKVKYKINDKHTICLNMLHSGDKVIFVDGDQDEVNTRYGNSYGWLTLNSLIHPRLFVRNVFSFSRITHNRQGFGYFDDLKDIDYAVKDRNQVNYLGLKQDWDIDLTGRGLLKCGFYYNYHTADYEYLNTIDQRNWIASDNYVVNTDSTYASLNPEGARFGGYLSNRFRIISSLTAEVGLRYDYNAYTDDRYLSPRINAVYALGKQTFLRGGWGYFHQSQRMHEIKVAYGETDFYPAQLSRHWVAGLEHIVGNGLNLRLEAYHKHIADPRPDHRTFSNAVEIFPEIEEDRFSLTFNEANSKGIELYMKYDQGGKLSYWTGYALAYSHRDVKNLFYQGETFTLEDPVVPHRYDQRHTMYLDLNYRPNRNWHLNASWQYHTGWPYTEKFIRTRPLPDGSPQYYAAYGRLYGSRLPSYHRMDVQISRHFHFSKSRLSLSLAAINLYNRNNVRNVKYSWRRNPDGMPYLAKREEYSFPLLPSLGISWTF